MMSNLLDELCDGIAPAGSFYLDREYFPLYFTADGSRLELPRERALLNTLITTHAIMLPPADRSCAICTSDYGVRTDDSDPEHAVELPGCGHTFGEACLRKWLSEKSTCPMCRKVLFVHDNAFLESALVAYFRAENELDDDDSIYSYDDGSDDVPRRADGSIRRGFYDGVDDGFDSASGYMDFGSDNGGGSEYQSDLI